MPVKLSGRLKEAGHDAQTVRSLKMIGIDNGTLFAHAVREFDLCFTRDADFAKRAREAKVPAKLKLLRVILEQKAEARFIDDFMRSFLASNWEDYKSGDAWP